MGTPEKTERNKAIAEKRKLGWTLKAIAAAHGISAPRVRQIILKQARIDASTWEGVK